MREVRHISSISFKGQYTVGIGKSCENQHQDTSKFSFYDCSYLIRTLDRNRTEKADFLIELKLSSLVYSSTIKLKLPRRLEGTRKGLGRKIGDGSQLLLEYAVRLGLATEGGKI